MACLDTDFLVALMRGQPDATRRARELDSEGARKTTTPVNAFELYLEAHLSESRDVNIQLVGEVLASLEILELDEKSCEMAGGIAAALKREGRSIGARDSLIAGVAQRFDQTLVTRNTQHFSRIEGLKVDTW